MFRKWRADQAAAAKDTYAPAQRVRISERPKRKEPFPYNGEPEKFRSWWSSVEEYLEYARGDYDSEADKISWIGGFCRDKALAWHQGRRDYIKELGQKDQWDLYVEALKKRFTDTYEPDENLRKMEELKYSGDISDYLTQMRTLNIRLRLAGTVWKRMIKKGLGKELFARFTLMDLPDDDDDFERRLEAVGKGMEEGNREAKALGLQAIAITRDGKDPRKEREKGKDRNQAGPSRSDRDKPDRKAKKPERGGDKERKPKPNSSTGKVIWTDKKEALMGIPTSDVDERARKGLCLRCAYDNHAWAHCRRREPVIGDPPKRSSATKRKAQDKPTEDSSSSNKKAKTSATAAAVTVQNPADGMETGSCSGGRIFEIDSDEDMDFC